MSFDCQNFTKEDLVAIENAECKPRIQPFYVVVSGSDDEELEAAYRLLTMHNEMPVIGTIGHIDHGKTTISKNEFILENNRIPHVDFKMTVGEYVPNQRKHKKQVDFIAKRRRK